MKDYFEKIYNESHYKMHHDADKDRRVFLSEIIKKYQKGTKAVLDVAIGLNPLILGLHCKEKYGVELSKAFAAKNRKRGIRCEVFDVNKGLPEQIKSKKFDVILCTEILEHLVDARPLLNDMRECLTDDGIIVITVPNELEFYGNRFTLFWRGDVTHMGVKFYDMQHLRFFTKRNLRKVLIEEGFTIKEFTGINFTKRDSIRGILTAPLGKEWLAKTCPKHFATNYVCVVSKRETPFSKRYYAEQCRRLK